MKCISVATLSSLPHVMGIFFPLSPTVVVGRPCGAELVTWGQALGSPCVCLTEEEVCPCGISWHRNPAQSVPVRDGQLAGRGQGWAVLCFSGWVSLVETWQIYNFSEHPDLSACPLPYCIQLRDGPAELVLRTPAILSEENLEGNRHSTTFGNTKLISRCVRHQDPNLYLHKLAFLSSFSYFGLMTSASLNLVPCSRTHGSKSCLHWSCLSSITAHLTGTAA